MSESSVELIATVGTVLAFLFAAAAGITSRRGIRLVVIGAVFLWLPLISEVRRTWIRDIPTYMANTNARAALASPESYVFYHSYRAEPKERDDED